MEYSQVILEMLERIKSLENRVSVLEASPRMSASPAAANTQLDRVSARYRRLAEYLLEVNQQRVTLSYEQIEAILEFTLPATARNHKQAFWANTTTHSYASSWMAVGYKAKVDPEQDTVTFTKNLGL